MEINTDESSVLAISNLLEFAPPLLFQSCMSEVDSRSGS